MATISFVRKFVGKLAPGEVFTTRDILNFGHRADIDMAIYVMVKREEITRLMRGVFQIPGSERVISAPELAVIKAKSFGRDIVTHALDAAKELGLVEEGNQELTYNSNGNTTSFSYRGETIHLKKTSPRAMVLGDSVHGFIIRALCYLKKIWQEHFVARATAHLSRTQRQLLRSSCSSMPSWLANEILPDLNKRTGIAILHNPVPQWLYYVC